MITIYAILACLVFTIFRWSFKNFLQLCKRGKKEYIISRSSFSFPCLVIPKCKMLYIRSLLVYFVCWEVQRLFFFNKTQWIQWECFGMMYRFFLYFITVYRLLVWCAFSPMSKYITVILCYVIAHTYIIKVCIYVNKLWISFCCL